MSETLLDAARATLEEEREHLRQQIAGVSAESGEREGFDENFADSSQVAAEQGEVRRIRENLEAMLGEVEDAITRIDAGTYGSCDVCGGAISEARLEAMPATRYCVDHA